MYGSEMEKVISYTATIGEITRESGRVIGKQVADVKPFLIDLEVLCEYGMTGRKLLNAA
ncbi:hypothetical protein [Oceanobacillus oncorhynchi]|uniref:hypothetical protein n=1 Tax=Oceanobacillus oncorhynchi TaxID=545501 RepID=UPI0034D5DCFA